MVIAFSGDIKTGKSFLLNYCLRYLYAKDTWTDDEESPLEGFDWSNGPQITTTGLQMWSEPFIIDLPSSEKVAVLLIDTTGVDGLTFVTKNLYHAICHGPTTKFCTCL